MNRLPRTLAAVVLTAASASLLASCGSDEPSESAIEKAIEDNTDQDVDVDVDGGEVKIDTDQGTVTSGKKIPDSFPKDDVPLVEGTVINGVETPQGTMVSVDYDGSAAEAKAEADKKLTGAGFTKDGEMGGVGAGYSNDSWQVVVAAIEASGKTIVNVTVAPKK